MPVAWHPPHRSQRAILSHWAPALSHHAKTLFWIRMIDRACRKTPLQETEGLFTCLFPLDGSGFGSSVCPDGFSPHLLARTRSRISLFRLKERIDRDPAISSVCHRRSLGLLNPYLSVFRVPMMPSVL